MIASRLQKFQGSSIFQIILQLTIKHNAVNLSSGFPQWKTPSFLKDQLKQVLDTNEDQYSYPEGHQLLRDTLAKIYSTILNSPLEGQKNVFIGNGATGVLFDAAFSLIEENDEIITFDPFFINNNVTPQLMGGKMRYVELMPPTNFNDPWMINFDQLQNSFNEKTKMIIINSPHNPTGKVFSDEEYQKIASILDKYPKVIVISDEVYDFITFDKKPFPRISTLKNMFDRTIIVGSLGKKFSCTGWRCGYAIANQFFIKCLANSQQNVCYSVNRPTQVAFAKALEIAEKEYQGFKNYYQYSSNTFEQNRNWIMNNLINCNIKWNFYKPEGGFFIIANIKDHIKFIPKKYFYQQEIPDGELPIGILFEELINPDYTPDIAFSKFLIEQYKVAVLPVSNFYNNQADTNKKDYKGKNLVRIALCTKQETLQNALKALCNLQQ